MSRERIQKKLRILLKHIPGFRSNEKINKIIASTYYIIFIFATTVCMIMHEFQEASIFGESLIFAPMIFVLVDQMNKSL